MKLVLDFVPNHSSNQHPWFVSSRSSRTNPKRDWYVWRDPAPGGGPPNNWLSQFGGGRLGPSMPRAGQYYLHSFLKEQPDLNWRNPQVRRGHARRAALLAEARGVDGFRVDVIWCLMKDEQLRDNPPNPDWTSGAGLARQTLLSVYDCGQPEIHDVIAAMRECARRLRRPAPDRRDLPAVGQSSSPTTASDGRGAQMPYNFLLITAEMVGAHHRRSIVTRYEAALPAGRLAELGALQP